MHLIRRSTRVNLRYWEQNRCLTSIFVNAGLILNKYMKYAQFLPTWKLGENLNYLNYRFMGYTWWQYDTQHETETGYFTLLIGYGIIIVYTLYREEYEAKTHFIDFFLLQMQHYNINLSTLMVFYNSPCS